MRRPCCAGFTLIEMVIAVLVLGILSVLLVFIVSGPMRASVETERRARLTDIAETALTSMTRELRLALPNSIRVATAPNLVVIEMLRTLDGGRYRSQPIGGAMPFCGAATNGDPLEFNCADAVFDVLGQLPQQANITTGGADCAADPTTADCVVVFNTGPAGANDAYSGQNVATIVAVGTGIDGSDQLTIANTALAGGNPAFPLASPAQRFHVVDGPVSFVCDTLTGQINRVDGYAFQNPQSTAPPGSSALLVNSVTGCDFAYDAGTATRGGLATLSLTLTEASSGATVTLVQQAHVSNQP